LLYHGLSNYFTIISAFYHFTATTRTWQEGCSHATMEDDDKRCRGTCALARNLSFRLIFDLPFLIRFLSEESIPEKCSPVYVLLLSICKVTVKLERSSW